VTPSTSSSSRTTLLLVAALAATATIVGLTWLPDTPALVWCTKPLATASLAVLALRTDPPIAARYRTLVALALVLSTVGDVLLMLPTDRFVAGLAAFLGAHVLYLAAFASRAALLRHRSGVIGYAAVATVVLALVLPVVGGVLRTAIIAYVIVIALMAAQATSWMLDAPTNRSARLAAIGASLFVASDALLALDRFVLIVPARDALVLAPYWLGQACLALSVAVPPAPALRLPS
jgi:uncharacterized membrane protein YhhN